MLEAVVSICTAAVTGMAILTQKVHNRINDLDKRVDSIELNIAQHYVTKENLAEIVNRFETQMIRIEDKLDRIVMNIPTN